MDFNNDVLKEDLSESPVAESEEIADVLPEEPSTPSVDEIIMDLPYSSKSAGTDYPPILGIPSPDGQNEPALDPKAVKLERSLSTPGYLLVLIAMHIPVVGLILTIVWACSAKRRSLKCLSRAMLIIWVLLLILGFVTYFFVSKNTVLVNYWINTFKDFFRFLK